MRSVCQQAFCIEDSSEIAAVRRAASALAKQLDFNELRVGQLALVITEAATNIIKHAQRGEILLRIVERGDDVGIEVIALDSGPGIINLDLQMKDGQSSAGSYGVGLGAIQRIAHEFDIYTQPGQGTALLIVMWAGLASPANLSQNESQQKDPARKDPWQVGSVCVPMRGEDVCGDAWYFESDGNTLTLLVTDGLGHGPDAAKASIAAVNVIPAGAHHSPAVLMQSAHSALHGTRGAAVAIVQIDDEERQLRFAGVGNIAVSMFTATERKHLLSHNGIVGSNLRKLQEFAFPWPEGAMLIAHSDGIGTRWNLDQYPGLAAAHPALTAAILYRDFTRGRDDATVVVVRDLARA